MNKKNVMIVWTCCQNSCRHTSCLRGCSSGKEDIFFAFNCDSSLHKWSFQYRSISLFVYMFQIRQLSSSWDKNAGASIDWCYLKSVNQTKVRKKERKKERRKEHKVTHWRNIYVFIYVCVCIYMHMCVFLCVFVWGGGLKGRLVYWDINGKMSVIYFNI